MSQEFWECNVQFSTDSTEDDLFLFLLTKTVQVKSITQFSHVLIKSVFPNIGILQYIEIETALEIAIKWLFEIIMFIIINDWKVMENNILSTNYVRSLCMVTHIHHGHYWGCTKSVSCTVFQNKLLDLLEANKTDIEKGNEMLRPQTLHVSRCLKHVYYTPILIGSCSQVTYRLYKAAQRERHQLQIVWRKTLPCLKYV